MHVHLNMWKETSIWITKYVFLFFPNFKQNAAIFPNSKGPWPQSQKGVWEPWCKFHLNPSETDEPLPLNNWASEHFVQYISQKNSEVLWFF